MESLTHDSLNLVTTDEKFYVVPSDSTEVLEIDRLNFDLRLINSTSRLNFHLECKNGFVEAFTMGAGLLYQGKHGVPTTPISQPVCLVFGIIHLVSGPYLIIVTNKSFVGCIDGHSVYEVTGTELISFSKTNIHLSESQERDNEAYLGMMRHLLSKPGFYFSYNYDLTHSVQRRHHLSQMKHNFSSVALHERADERFVWNTHLLQDFVILPELRRFITPVIHGFIFIKKCSINGKYFTFSIISRRSTQRAGVRYYMRGVDSTGSVANFVETEQIVLCGGHAASFVQTRGSIPLQWSQRPSLKYKPTPVLVEGVNQKRSMQKHFDEQISHYGQQVIINLIDQKGSEQKLGDAYHRYIMSLASCLIWYDAFDFHKECSNMRWHRLSILANRLAPKQEEFGYFMRDLSGTVVSVQKGVFRTNCIDCLDRTNVVQSLLAHKSLQEQLQRMDVLNIGEKLEDKREFEVTFKDVWAENADFCAKQYTGTRALKTDFTRTGRRTCVGLIKDGWNSAVRYYYNNFTDGYKQDALDVFLGNYIIDRWGNTSLLHIQRAWKFRLVPVIFLITVSMFFMSLLIPSTDPLLQMIYVLFWGTSVIGTMLYIYIHGKEFVDIPRLVLTDKC